jgi:hypothetical protein
MSYGSIKSKSLPGEAILDWFERNIGAKTRSGPLAKALHLDPQKCVQTLANLALRGRLQRVKVKVSDADRNGGNGEQWEYSLPGLTPAVIRLIDAPDLPKIDEAAAKIDASELEIPTKHAKTPIYAGLKPVSPRAQQVLAGVAAGVSRTPPEAITIEEPCPANGGVVIDGADRRFLAPLPQTAEDVINRHESGTEAANPETMSPKTGTGLDFIDALAIDAGWIPYQDAGVTDVDPAGDSARESKDAEIERLKTELHHKDVAIAVTEADLRAETERLVGAKTRADRAESQVERLLEEIHAIKSAGGPVKHASVDLLKDDPVAYLVHPASYRKKMRMVMGATKAEKLARKMAGRGICCRVFALYSVGVAYPSAEWHDTIATMTPAAAVTP